MMYTKYFIATAVMALAGLCSCTKDNVSQYSDGTACSDTISFSQKIQPMILQNCATSGCHDASSNQSGFDFSSYAGVAANASQALGTMQGQPVLMPYGGPALPDSLIQQFQCWINQGKQNN